MHFVMKNIELFTSSIGTRRHITVYHFGVERREPKIYLHAGLHADEPPGMLVLHHLIRLLQERDDEPKGEIIVVPCANPIGLSQRMQGYHTGRSDLGVGGNFNRNFPDISSVLREELSLLRSEGHVLDEAAVRLALRKAVAAVVSKTELDSMKNALLGLAIDADYVVDAHCDAVGVVHAYVSDLDHPAAQLLSRNIGSVVTIGTSSVPSSSFSAGYHRSWRTARELLPDVPITRPFAAVVEYRGQTDVRDDVAIEDARGLMGFMEAVGILKPAGKAQPKAPTLYTTAECLDYIQASVPGVITFSKMTGEEVAVGEEIAQILDPTTGERTSVTARSSGVIFAHTGSRVALPGTSIVSIASTSPLDRDRADPHPV
ncbi:succinylglutamate desuccinylase/aspartoacylase family protein [Bradyrhizobium sp. BWA-3-5]|uniref:succinylglutamate desuccinylase/aspartoacylase domain-containing protein n=1 Tax=Bradyrhizobium sp. BWA-3-5 TaxID=3080013 RepID=UPI00293E29DF|nr:succinylglutamate desuccinylase/aspartoacylase family protein [Bradyrhizobium sp. BWA-3-5]WOH63952.1 succinylglutamate desuccinylase/aspartoacylase family protein [Bradyrhizobium sp. BWA-3-5]